jgi:hypothetical protein
MKGTIADVCVRVRVRHAAGYPSWEGERLTGEQLSRLMGVRVHSCVTGRCSRCVRAQGRVS